MYLPAGCKNAKINLLNAYRTTITHIQVGDVIRVDRYQTMVNGTLIPTPTHSPARSFWATVEKVDRETRQIQITTDKGTMGWEFPHTSITRKERASEKAERLALAAAAMEEVKVTARQEAEAELAAIDERAQEDAARQAEEIRLQNALAAHPTPREALVAELDAARAERAAIVYGVTTPNLKKRAANARIEAAERALADFDAAPVIVMEETPGADALAGSPDSVVDRMVAKKELAAIDAELSVKLAHPAKLAVDLVTIARDNGEKEPITSALAVMNGILEGTTGAEREYNLQVIEALELAQIRARQVAATAAMRQAPPVDYTHDFVGGHSGMVCTKMVERPDGTGDACGEPIRSAIHDPVAYAAYAAELKKELAVWGKPTGAELDRMLDEAFPAGPPVKSAETRLLNAEGTVRNLLADAKTARTRYAARGEESDRHAWERARARVQALEEVLELLTEGR